VSAAARPKFVLTLLAWAGGLSGGDRHLLEVAARWKEHVDIVVVAPEIATTAVGELAGDVRFRPLGSASPFLKRFPPALALEYIRRAAVMTRTDLRPADVVVAGSHFLPDAAALARLSRDGAHGVAYVYHLVADRSGLNPRTLWSKADERFSLALIRRHAKTVFTSNAGTAASLVDRGFEPVHTRVGIELDRFLGYDRRRKADQAVFVARMTHTKGVLDAISAWKKVVERVPAARLIMVGEGPDREKGMLHARTLQIETSVEWPGFVTEHEKRLLLAESSVLVAPSREEGWGIAICEALASGLPVVAYRLPVLDELFPSAYSAAPLGEINDLAARIVAVLGDDVLSDHLAALGREVALRYDVNRVAEVELEEIMRGLSGRRD
jgi:glycosyltransferase involved in cell wall biosynthesis